MSNTKILALPDVVAALQSWWDETPGRMQVGLTSSVVADLLEDHGWAETGEWVAPLLPWMRGQHPRAGDCHPDGSAYPFHEAAGIFRVSVATAHNPRIIHMVNWFGEQLRARGVASSDMAREAVTLISAEDCGRLGRTREFRDSMVYKWYAGPRHAVFACGFAPLYGGMHFKMNDVQPVGQIDCWCGEHCVTARVY